MTFQTGVQKDIETDKWFFLIFDESDDVEFQSEPVYEEEDQAETAAIEWIKKNKL